MLVEKTENPKRRHRLTKAEEEELILRIGELGGKGLGLGCIRVTNVTAEKVTDIRETPGLLTTQISSPVRWMQSMERMIADGVDTFVEIGPGKTLEGFLRKIDRSVKVFHISQWEDVDKVCTELADSGKMMEEA